MTRRARLFATVCTLAIALPLAISAQAQDPVAPPATLIADNIVFDGASGNLVARGTVEIFHGGNRLRATAVHYNRDADRVSVTGPLSLTDATGQTVILADFADLSSDLQDGILQGARIVLDQQLQIATTEIDRSEGRYTQAYQVTASSCEVCFDNPTPLWEIRARRVVHDQDAQQLYFDNASLRVMGVPVAYVPRLRLPDPTLERATGFLTPTIRSDNTLGTYLVVPYFFRLGDHADLTATPWIGRGNTTTMELRYRQAFVNGDLTVDGALSRDNLTPNDFRGYIFADGTFDLRRDFELRFALQGVTDRGYLTTYGFPDSDLLESFVTIDRARRDQFLELNFSILEGLQADDNNQTLPTRTGNATAIHRFTPGVIGGIATVGVDVGGYYRLSDTPGPLGRDVTRASGSAEWRRDGILPGGFLLGAEVAVFGDVYNTQQGTTFDGTDSRVTPMAAVELRYPMQRTTAGGVAHLLEPVAQLAWSESAGDAVPVEDSAIVEFDEANLFALDRFPGHDTREEGRRLNLGLTYTRIAPTGWSLGLTGGVVLRDRDMMQFTQGSGLSGTQSDYLVAAHVQSSDGLMAVNRAIFDQGLDFTSNELSLAWMTDDTDLMSTFTFLEADPGEGRPLDTSEWALDASYDFTDNWEAGVNWRYDFAQDEATRAELALSYSNECAEVAFTMARRFTDTATLDPTTEFGLTVQLNGFGASRNGRSQDRSCMR
jgi:LPS-assembly protein